MNLDPDRVAYSSKHTKLYLNHTTLFGFVVILTKQNDK